MQKSTYESQLKLEQDKKLQRTLSETIQGKRETWPVEL